MDALINPLSTQFALVVAPKAAKTFMLDLAAQLAVRGMVRVLDGGNSFNAYAVSREIRRHTHDLFAALERVQIARAFTCYQMVTLLMETPTLAHPTLVTDLLDTYYDENVPLDESNRLLKVSLAELVRLSTHGPVVVSARPPKGTQPERIQLLQTLEETADQVYFMGQPAVPELPARLF